MNRPLKNSILFIKFFIYERTFFRLSATAIAALCACAPVDGPHRQAEEGGRDSSGAQTAGLGVGYDQVRPVFAAICASCHPSRSGPDWLQYDQAKAYALSGQLAGRVFVSKTMPPIGSPQAAMVTDAQRRMLAQWAQGGAPLQAPARGAPRGTAGPSAESDGPERVCLQCHGASGPGPASQPPMPRLNGQNFDYLIAQLESFKWRRRVDPSNAMNEIALATPPADLRQAARYFAEQTGLTPRSLSRGAGGASPIETLGRSYADSRCSSCHMNPDSGDRPPSSLLPALAGQSRLYLTNQLIQFRNGSRPNALMYEFARRLSDQEIEALALYFAELN